MAFNKTIPSAQLFQEMFDIIVGSAVVDPASVATGANGNTTVTVPGLALGDTCLAFFPGVDLSNVQVTVSVTAANTAKIQVQNTSGGAVDLASSTWRFVFARPKGVLSKI